MTFSLDSAETSSSNQHTMIHCLSPAETLTANTYKPGLYRSGRASSQLDLVLAAQMIASLSQSACLPLVHAHVTEPHSSRFSTPPPAPSLLLAPSSTHIFTLGCTNKRVTTASCKVEQPVIKIWVKQRKANGGMFAVQKDTAAFSVLTIHFACVHMHAVGWIFVLLPHLSSHFTVSAPNVLHVFVCKGI